LKRVCGVRDLLLFNGSFLSRKLGWGGGESESMEDKKKMWREYSEAIEVQLGKGLKYAQSLRCWEREKSHRREYRQVFV
jgi:hypothetical protein